MVPNHPLRWRPKRLLLARPSSLSRAQGSFTTPPCTEGVVWVVMRDPVTWSKAQIDRFRASMVEAHVFQVPWTVVVLLVVV